MIEAEIDPSELKVIIDLYRALGELENCFIRGNPSDAFISAIEIKCGHQIGRLIETGIFYDNVHIK